MAEHAPLVGRTVVTTRERAGALDAVLTRLGATVVHVPLITVSDAADDGDALRRRLEDADSFDWVVVTSAAGAERVGAALAGTRCKIAAVGTRTAAVVEHTAGRRPDVIPERQTGAELVAAMPTPPGPQRLLLAQADRADPATAVGLSERGYSVVPVTAYRTELRRPTAAERAAMLAADAVGFASGSAVRAWSEAVGTQVPPVVAVIGPSTEAVAHEVGVKVTVVAADHSIEGLAVAIVRAFEP